MNSATGAPYPSLPASGPRRRCRAATGAGGTVGERPRLRRQRFAGQAGETRALLLLGVLAFLAFCVAFAPARLMAPLAERIDGAALSGATGTVWAGSGRLLLAGRDSGRLAWSFRPTTLFRLFPGIGWTLSGERLNLQGRFNLAPGRAALSISGSVDAEAVNPWLETYELSMAGDFEIRDLHLHVTGNRPDDTRGTISWSGGRLRYVLSQRANTAELPPLDARLSFADGPEATVVARGGSTPLLEAELLESGFARIGVTMLLTKMLNQPWPAGGADDKVVLAVEEKIL